MSLQSVQRTTEQMNPACLGLDRRAPAEILALLQSGQQQSSECVSQAIPQIEKAASLAAKCITSDGRLVYVGAGSAGIVALADGLELPGTFGIPRDKIVILLAGGAESLVALTGSSEDVAMHGSNDVANSSLTRNDCVIFVSASGSTPYTLGAMETAKFANCPTIAISNTRNSPLLANADVAIHLDTPPEVIAGSTRMGAATAQKIALNMISTMMAVHLGHVHDGFMVNVIADNEKLRSRAAHIVSTLGDCTKDASMAFLKQSKGHVKPAVLLASGCTNLNAANAILEKHNQKLRPSMSELVVLASQLPTKL